MESHAGRVEGELNLRLPTDLRALYHVPFKARDAAKNPEAVKVLNDCCAEWVQSVDKGKSGFEFSRPSHKFQNKEVSLDRAYFKQ